MRVSLTSKARAAGGGGGGAATLRPCSLPPPRFSEVFGSCGNHLDLPALATTMRLMTVTVLAAASAAAAAAAAAPVETLILRTQVPGRAPVAMPTLSLGTGGFDNATAAAAVGAAYAAGFRAFHAAFDYFNLPGVGRGLAVLPRDDIFVTAMTSPCVHTASPPVREVVDAAACTALTEHEINQTLALLGLASVDLLLLHGPSEPFGYQGGCDANVSAINSAQWAAYTHALHDGRARSIGVSNYCQSCLRGLSSAYDAGVGAGGSVAPSVNQLQLHVGTGPDPGTLMSFCAEEGIVVQAYSPLAAGGVVTDPLCEGVGRDYNRSAAEVGLRWVVEKNRTAVVVKASDPTYLAEDAGVFGWEHGLSAADTARLDGATVPKGQQDGRPSWGCGE